MTTLAVLFIALSLFLYVILGGADYGAGIIELFTGSKGAKIISKAIAPVWEANHIWLIVVIVILFNAFPEVYSTLTLYLHIPLMLILFGIIFRGTSFAFRYYDPYKDRSHQIYTSLFKIFSIFTPFFLGVTLGAAMAGNLTTETMIGFYGRFVAPWFDIFPVALGLFMIVLFAYLAAAYLAGEPADAEMNKLFRKYARRLLASLILCGVIVFVAAHISGLPLFKLYMKSWEALTCVILATILLPAMFWSLKNDRKTLIRIIAAAQAGAILIGWFAVQLPVLVAIKGGQSLTIYNAVAPEKSVRLMVIALFGGLAFVIPLLVYLFRIFKFPAKE
jgi:cytochrome bd ubiquinol oxidase subunit II